ncbi:hypothetical protein ACFYRN_44940 [Streptomyces sp. NPDC005227]|uniref:hypothetical protein n=1 Tax=Streptomyces sp. NPDC005227 TaxID=3364707 RepID=UPI0036B3B935
MVPQTNPRYRSRVQEQRTETAYEAIRTGSSLPGDNPDVRLHAVDAPLRTHLTLLKTATERAATEGIFAAKVPGSRLLVVIDAYGVRAQGWTRQEFNERLGRVWNAVRRRARIGDGLDRSTHPHRTTAQLKRVLGRTCHDSILSNDRVSIEPGTVQSARTPRRRKSSAAPTFTPNA